MDKQLDDWIKIRSLMEISRDLCHGNLPREYVHEVLREVKSAVNTYETKYNTLFDYYNYEEVGGNNDGCTRDNKLK